MNHRLASPYSVTKTLALSFTLVFVSAQVSAQQAENATFPVPEASGSDFSLSTQEQDLVTSLDKSLALSDSQKANVDGIVKRHQDQISTIRTDLTLGASNRLAKMRENRIEMANEIRPFLQRNQMRRLDWWLWRAEMEDKASQRTTFVPLLSVTLGEYFPTDGQARQIFGSGTAFVGVGIREFEKSPLSNDLIGISLNTVHVGGSGNDFWAVSPQVTYEHRLRVTPNFTLYGKLLGGPAYMDYSFDFPDGEHFGAKRWGLAGELELGLRWGRFQFNAQYHALTEPQDVNFNGFELSLTWIAVRF